MFAPYPQAWPSNLGQTLLRVLASRIPYNEAITADKLRSVEHAEDALMDAGFPQIRCRAHGDLARIEVAPTSERRLWTH